MEFVALAKSLKSLNNCKFLNVTRILCKEGSFNVFDPIFLQF